MNDLISVFALKEWILNWHVMNVYYHPYSKLKTIPVAELYDILDRMPKLDAVKHGHWFHYEGMLFCSECHQKYYDEIQEYCGDDVPKYCPNCGADMREERR